MPLRDFFLFFIVFGSLPFVLKRPCVGVMVCTWLGYMIRSGSVCGGHIRFRCSGHLDCLFALDRRDETPAKYGHGPAHLLCHMGLDRPDLF